MSEYAQSLTEPVPQLDASYAAQRASQELDETTRSDISERPSVEDVESETGSTGALETRSLKDHKGEARQICSWGAAACRHSGVSLGQASTRL